MNAYQRRHLAGLSARAADRARVSEAQKTMRLAYADALASRYEAAYHAATGQTVRVRYTNGWFRFTGSMYRRAELERMATVLEARAAALVNPDEES